MRQVKAKVLSNREIAPRCFRMALGAPSVARGMRPGQFVHVLSSEGYEPLLRRPFSLHRISKEGIEILYKVVGRGTELLSQKKCGEKIDLIGPLGNGFTYDLTPHTFPPSPFQATADPPKHVSAEAEHFTPIIVAGGMGVAPLLALAEKIAYSVKRRAYRKKAALHVLIGAYTKSHILCEKEFKKLGFKTHIATEDGSKGKKGLITEVLKDLLSAIRYPLSARLYTCGPYAMLREAARLAARHGIACEVSLEERMACGVGVCLGCPVKVRVSYAVRSTTEGSPERSRRTPYAIRNTQYEYKMVCKDGPVFNAANVVWSDT